MIIVYTGNGKGKTTAALGLILRSVGWGKRVLIVQFLKKRISGEVKVLNELRIMNYELRIKRFGTKELVDLKHLREIDYLEAKKGFDYSLSAIYNSLFDIIVLDEINVALKFGLIKVNKVLELIMIAKEKGVDLVLTGRWAHTELVEVADLVTEFKEIKHPFKKNGKAKKGIDY
ncbi:MAG: cob(I)yrinic acid a,c-diamide adenosyltransferase [Candidatus Gottesmanbacteria bacterium]